MSTNLKDNTILNTENSKLREKIIPILINTGIALVSGLLVGVLFYLTYNYITKKDVPAGNQDAPQDQSIVQVNGSQDHEDPGEGKTEEEKKAVQGK